MKISIFGLGYVGSVSLGCLAQNGHEVIGVDVSPSKVNCINRGQSPIIERDMERVIAEQWALGRVTATSDIPAAVQATDVSFICVGTPSSRQGHLDLEGIFRVGRDLAAAIVCKDRFHVVAIRSTVMPGTNEKLAGIIEQVSGRVSGKDFAVVSNPEFLREGTAIKDYLHPPYTLLGSACPKAVEVMKDVYCGVNAPVIVTDIRIAELIKYVSNSFHALKICFANEIGNICKHLNIDAPELMEIFCRDTKLNISPCYLKPGFAYGGSCLPKDLKALCTIAHDGYLRSRVLESIDASNENQKSVVLDRIVGLGRQRIGFLGLSFKGGTDDLRSSPIIDILEKLIGKGYEVRIYDRNVHLSQLVGANREFILQRIPLISRFIVEDACDVVGPSEVIVIVNDDATFPLILGTLPADKIVIDLANVDFPGRDGNRNYMGIAW